MFKNVSIGVYHPGESILHRLQARTKLLAMVWLVVAVVIANHREWHFAPYIAITGLVVAGLVTARVTPREIWRRMWILILLLLLSVPVVLPNREVDPRLLYTVGSPLLTYGMVRNVLLIGIVPIVLYYALHLLPQRYLSRQPRWFKRLWRPLLILSLVFFILNWFVGRQPAAHAITYTITYGGVWLLVTGSAVLLIFFALSVLMTMTTSPVQLIEGMTMLLAPLRRLKMPVDDFALMSLIALRFVPTLLEEVEQLIKAQTARGADVANGKLGERMQSASMIVVPLMQSILRRASELSTALEARGYEVEGRQTFLHETRLGLLDYLVLALVFGVMVGALML